MCSLKVVLISARTKKFRSSLFKGSWVWATPKKSCFYCKFSGTNSNAVCVLKQSLKKQATAFKKYHFLIKMNDFLCCYRNYKAFAIVFKPPNSKLFGYQNFALSKVLWALPTPTTFKKVDQIFIFEYKVCANLSKNFPTVTKHNLCYLNIYNITKKLKLRI